MKHPALLRLPPSHCRRRYPILGASRFDLCVTQCTPSGRSYHNQRASGVDRSFFDVAAVEQVLVNGFSGWSMDDALGLGVVPKKIALVRQSAHSIIENADATSKTALTRIA